MKKILAIICAIAVLFLGALLVHTATDKSGILFTNDVADYGTDKYHVPLTVFPAELHTDVKVVDFSYYSYWNETEDIYLELKFDSSEQMESYLSTIQNASQQLLANYTSPLKDEWFVEEQNVYNSGYTDLFCAMHHYSQYNSYYTGYSIAVDSEDTNIYCSFGIISYAFDELTVIHSYACGNFQDSIHNYTPKYLERFYVPLNQEHDRLILLQ